MEARLVVIGGKSNRSEIKLKLPSTFGRGSESDITISHAAVSRNHCVLEEVEGALVLRDTGSTNGTFFGKQRIKDRMVIRPGDLFSIGPLTFRAEYDHEGRFPALGDPRPGRQERSPQEEAAIQLPAADDELGFETATPASGRVSKQPAEPFDLGLDEPDQDGSDQAEAEPEATSGHSDIHADGEPAAAEVEDDMFDFNSKESDGEVAAAEPNDDLDFDLMADDEASGPSEEDTTRVAASVFKGEQPAKGAKPPAPTNDDVSADADEINFDPLDEEEPAARAATSAGALDDLDSLEKADESPPAKSASAKAAKGKEKPGKDKDAKKGWWPFAKEDSKQPKKGGQHKKPGKQPAAAELTDFQPEPEEVPEPQAVADDELPDFFEEQAPPAKPAPAAKSQPAAAKPAAAKPSAAKPEKKPDSPAAKPAASKPAASKASKADEPDLDFSGSSKPAEEDDGLNDFFADLGLN